MYFLDDEHEANFIQLIELFGLQQRRDLQYEATLYIAALPDVFILLDELDKEAGSPLYKLTTWNEDVEEYVISSPGLTGTTRRLASLGLSCFNGYKVDLDDMLGNIDDTYYKVLLETLRIRKG